MTSCRCFWKILEALQLKQYKLDPAYYYTSPELAWDACLKETKQEFPLHRDYDMLMMFEQDITGGITPFQRDIQNLMTNI